jgi:hypothetical protein
MPHIVSQANIVDSQLDQVTGTKFAVDCQVEDCKITLFPAALELTRRTSAQAVSSGR